MLARAKGVVRNAVGVVCVISVMAWLALGCGLLGPKAPRVEVLDARELALDLYKGRASLASVLSALEATPAEIVALAQAFDACNGVKSIPAQPEGVSI
jgi:hypothetical protein